MNSLLWMLDDSPATEGGLVGQEDFASLWNSIWPVLTTVIWVIVGVLGVVLVIKGVTTALAVVKAADEPQVRQEKIGSFKYMAIGVAIAMVIVSVMNIALGIFTKNLGITVE